MVEEYRPKMKVMPVARPIFAVQQDSTPENAEGHSSEDNDSNFTESVNHKQEERPITEESKSGQETEEEKQRRLDKNVEEFEKKLSDFERMFLYVNDELDFTQLSYMAQSV